MKDAHHFWSEQFLLKILAFRHVNKKIGSLKDEMFTVAINQKGLQPALDILKKLGGWPVLEGDSWNDENFNWQQLISKFKNQGLPVINFFESGVIVDFKNSSKRVLYIDQPFLDLTTENVEAYYNYMVDIAVIFGADKIKAKWELKRSLDLEINLVNISTPDEKRQQGGLLNDLMTITELQQKYSIVSWKGYFDALLKPNNEVQGNDEVLVEDTNFFKEFDKLIKKFSKRDQANFIMWKVVKEMISYLSDDVRIRELKFLTDISGQKEREPRWKECISLAKDNFGHSIGSVYVSKYFNKESRKDVEEMFNNIREEFDNILKTLNWVDEKTKEGLLEKLRSMRAFIAYADELLDDKKIDEFYKNLEISTGDHLQSMLNLTLFNENYLLGLWKEPVNKTSWTISISPVVVDTFYALNIETVLVPGGILQEAFYSKDRPTYMNYAAIGFLISHEITHFFDNNMNKIDERENLAERRQKKTAEKYRSNVECFIRQYGNYTAKNVSLNLNGLNTQRENIADNGGITIAYLAYQEWIKRHGPEIRLPDLNYTQSQLFWISAAQMWCTKYRSEHLKNKVLDDVYSPAEFRVLGSFSNRPEFAKDFNCHNNSKMTAKNKCSVW